MKDYDIATILWAIKKSLSIMIKQIDMGKQDLAKSRAELTIVAIDKVIGCKPERKHHPPHAAII